MGSSLLSESFRRRAGPVLLGTAVVLALAAAARPLAPNRPVWAQVTMALVLAVGTALAAFFSSLRGRSATAPLSLYAFLVLAIDGIGQAAGPLGWPTWPFLVVLVAAASVAEPFVIAVAVAAFAAVLQVAEAADSGFVVWKPAAAAVAGYGLLVLALQHALADEKRRLGAALASLARIEHGIDHLAEAEGPSTPVPAPVAPLRGLTEEERRSRQTERAAELDISLSRLVTVARTALAAHAVLVFAVDRAKQAAYLRAAAGPDSIVGNAVLDTTADPLAFVVERAQTFYATDFRKLLHALSYYRGEVKVGTLLAVPVLQGEIVTAVLVADQLEVQAFTGNEPALLESFGEMAGEIFARARVTASREELGTGFEAAYGVSQQLAAMVEVSPVCRTLLDSSRQLVPLEGGAIVLSDEGQTRYVLQEAFGWAREFESREVALDEKTWAAWALRSAEEHYLLDDLGREKDRMPILVLDEDSRSVESLLVLPLRTGHRALGAVVLTAKRRIFNATALHILRILANQAAASLSTIQLVEREKHKALHDPLTGLNNRRAFAEQLSQSLGREERHDGRLALVMLDLDHFKKLNDTYGHPAGDAALKNTAQVLRRLLRRGDVAARYGGEEFVVMLPASNEAGAGRFAERIRAALEESEVAFGDAMLRVTASVGLAVWPDDAKDPEALLAAADRALYAAKGAGRNRVVHASSQGNVVPT